MQKKNNIDKYKNIIENFILIKRCIIKNLLLIKIEVFLNKEY